MKKKLMALVLVLTLCAALTPVLAASGGEQTGAPEAEHFELRTYRETSLGGQLTATDPEGEPVTFALTTEPMKGTVEIEPGGAFVYTPGEGKKGKDYFGYKAIDAPTTPTCRGARRLTPRRGSPRRAFTAVKPSRARRSFVRTRR